jgi:hypothetical protein
METDKIAKLERRCPLLGGPIQFSYCSACGESRKVCFKILDCWWEYFDVTSYLKSTLAPQEFANLKRAKPPGKINSLIGLIQKAKQNTKSF